MIGSRIKDDIINLLQTVQTIWIVSCIVYS